MAFYQRLSCILLFIIILDCVLATYAVKTFSFRRYPYRKKQRNERRIRNMRMQCEETQRCLGLTGLESTSCVRQCISSRCYDEIYAFDELEEGEIDVRFNSFKGCVVDEKPTVR